MVKIAPIFVATAAMVLAGAAYAQQTSPTDKDTVGQVQISARTAYQLAPREFDDYANTYDLSTGDSIRLRESSGRYFVHVNNEREVEIFGQGPGVFLSTAGTRIEFRDGGDTVLVAKPGALPGAPRSLAVMPGDALLLVTR